MSTPFHHPTLTPELAGRYARMALDNIAREYPAKLDHVINGPGDVRAPSALHPLFHGSFDWHSCVHSHWMLARLLRLFPGEDFAPAIRDLFARRLTAANVAGEVAYLRQDNRASFVRTYGWAWLLKLAEELELGSGVHAVAKSHDVGRSAQAALGLGSRAGAGATSLGARYDAQALLGFACSAVGDAQNSSIWRDTLRPLANVFIDFYLSYLPRARVPLRNGLHPNSAFGLMFAIDFAKTSGNRPLLELCNEKALDWFAADTDYPARLEPSGNEFLSPALIEADLMRRVLDQPSFSAWLQRFLPHLAAAQPVSLFIPAEAGDRTDPQMVHLDGLNLSRAWCLRGIANVLDESDSRCALLRNAAELHLAAAMPTVQSGDYMGEHWLATFAVYALT